MTSALPTAAASMSDDELRAACAPRPWELHLERLGCLLSLVVSACSAGAGAWLCSRIPGAGTAQVVGGGTVLFCFVSVASLLHVGRAAGRRRAPFRAELRFRYGMSPAARYLDEERAVQGEGSPTWSLLLTAAALPHGGHRWVRIRAWRTPAPRARLEVRTVSWTDGSDEIEHAQVVRREAELPEQAWARIVKLLEDPGLGSLTTVESRVVDGLPCTMAVVDRESGRVHSASCNLAGLPDDRRDHPTVRLAQAILDAGARASGLPLLVGWCGATGDIGVDTT